MPMLFSTRRQQVVGLSAALLLLLAASSASVDLSSSNLDSTLGLDDECQPPAVSHAESSDLDSEASGCALSALQHRGGKLVGQQQQEDGSGRAAWCQGSPPAALWAPAEGGPEVQIKVLSYNLFWWSLFGKRGGNGNSAGKLIKANMQDQPFDVMGFQECEGREKVLGPVGLLGEYTVLKGEHAVCMAFRTAAWTVLSKGVASVAEDMKGHYYGKRGAQWVRLSHVSSGRKLFFVNHHGPLEVNSGGECGGVSVAQNLVKLMHEKAKPGDALILTGDFNANSASLTVQELWSRMVLVHSGDSFGGVDNIFGNMPVSAIVSKKSLGSGGSDHDAIEAVVSVGGPPRAASQDLDQKADEGAAVAASALKTNPPGYEWTKFWCGLLENGVDYVVAAGSWEKVIRHHLPDSDMANSQRCCRACQAEPKCSSWSWSWDGSKPAHCRLQAGKVEKKVPRAGFVSGLPANAAANAAAASARSAISALPASGVSAPAAAAGSPSAGKAPATAAASTSAAVASTSTAATSTSAAATTTSAAATSTSAAATTRTTTAATTTTSAAATTTSAANTATVVDSRYNNDVSSRYNKDVDSRYVGVVSRYNSDVDSR